MWVCLKYFSTPCEHPRNDFLVLITLPYFLNLIAGFSTLFSSLLFLPFPPFAGYGIFYFPKVNSIFTISHLSILVREGGRYKHPEGFSGIGWH